MSSTTGKPGYKGKVTIGDLVVCGMATWNYGGSTRDLNDDSEFGDEDKSFAPLQSEGGEITMSGKFLQDVDAGQQVLKDAYDNAEELTDIRLYVDLEDEKYYSPDPNTAHPSYCTVTKADEVGCDKAGIVTINYTLKVSGRMKFSTSTTQVAVATIGDIDVADETVTLLGNLTSLGEEADVDCYFEYGTTDEYGSDTSADKNNMDETGLFDNALTGLTPETTYHYRAVARTTDSELTETYGIDKTFTTIAA